MSDQAAKDRALDMVREAVEGLTLDDALALLGSTMVAVLKHVPDEEERWRTLYFWLNILIKKLEE